MNFENVYKNRAQAYRFFIAAQKLPVSQAKFYQDAERLRLMQPDKSLRLGDLLAYVKEELKVDPVSGQSLQERDQARERADLEIRKLRAEIEAKEKANRRDDGRWMERVEHETQMAAFVGRLEEALQQVTALRLPELVFRAGGAPERAADLHEGLDALYAAAFTEAVRDAVQPLAFAEDAANAA